MSRAPLLFLRRAKMYEITRRSKIKEVLAVNNADGSKAFEVPVEINVDTFVGRWNKARVALAEAQADLQADKTDAKAQRYGESVIALMRLVFGDDGAEKLIDFYANDYTEMLLDVFPFIADRIEPQVNAATDERVKQLKKAAGIVGKRI